MDTVDCGSWAELEAPATAVRRAVFVAEQGVDESEELDGRDADAHHVVAYEDGTPVGTARLRLVDDAVAKAERVAVVEAPPGTGGGTAPMGAVADIFTERGATRLRLHAQTPVRGCY